MQEDKQDTDGTDVLHQEDVEMEQRPVTQCPPVGKLIPHNLMRHEPADEDTGQEAHDGQEQLACHKVEQVEDRLAKHLYILADAQ